MARGRQAFVVDTNVLVAANRRQGEPLACANACAQGLLRIKTAGLLALDEGGRILQEYRRYSSFSGQPGIGDSFFKWVHDNLGRQDLIHRVRITPSDRKEFQEFPDSSELAGFDRSDRKFVAVALSHAQKPPVLNATDRDWWDYREALQAAGVRVVFLCPEQAAL